MMKKNGHVWLKPGDPGYDSSKFPWEQIGKHVGLSQEPKVRIDGFYLVDKRHNPPIAIFSNCSFPMSSEVKPCLTVQPQPWRSPGEAANHIKSLHLSGEQEELCLYGKGPIRICAMAPDPGIGYPKPNKMVMDKKTFNSW